MNWETYREQFPITRHFNFQNHAAVAPLSRRAAEAGAGYFAHASEKAYLEGDFFKRADTVRQLAARLIGANADEIAFIKNTSEGLSFVANGLNWKNGDNVVIANVEFAANVYPWMALQAKGVQMRTVIEDNGRIPIQDLFEAIDARTRVVSISSVQYASGYRTDLATLGEYCKSKGVFLCVDAIQSLGAFPLNVAEMNIDFLSADGHKWLCGPEGLGIFYVSKELHGHLRPSTIGWLSMKNPFKYGRYQFEFEDSAKRYECGSYNLAGIFALGAAIELILDIGVEQIARRLLELTDGLVDGLRRKGYRVISSRERNEASGIVAFISDTNDLINVRNHLEREHRVVIAHRCGRLRASPHFYNTEREIEQLVELLPK